MQQGAQLLLPLRGEDQLTGLGLVGLLLQTLQPSLVERFDGVADALYRASHGLGDFRRSLACGTGEHDLTTPQGERFARAQAGLELRRSSEVKDRTKIGGFISPSSQAKRLRTMSALVMH